MAGNKKPNQCDRILRYMEQFGSISPAEAITHLSCYRLASRIYEIVNNRGIKIESKTEYFTNAFGEKSHYSRYFLAKE
jgi:hypothetical protein